MNFTTKKKLVLCMLGVIAIWPMIHPFFISKVGLTPWKGGGWAMYCVPKPVVNVMWRLVDVKPGKAPKADEKLKHKVEAEFTRFDLYRSHYSRHEPKRLASAVLKANPQAGGVEFMVIELQLDKATAKLVEANRDTFRFTRTQLGL